MAFVADNMSHNMGISASINFGFVGFAIHRFTLAVQENLSKHCTIICKVYILISKLRNFIAAAELRQFASKVEILNTSLVGALKKRLSDGICRLGSLGLIWIVQK